MSMAVMVAFARSGGTLLNRCLGSLPGVVILSEVSPLGGGSGTRGSLSYATVKEQARNWYGIEIAADGFGDAIRELAAVCGSAGQSLVVRDWSYVSFMPHEYNGWNPPYRFTTLDALHRVSDLRRFALVRDAIDVWISRGQPPADEFFPHYLRFVQAVTESDIPVFKYEEFCRRPRRVMRQICETTGLVYSESFLDYESFLTVHGDVQYRGGSRGSKKNNISSLPRRAVVEDRVSELHRCAEMVEANRLLGYSSSYYGGPQWAHRIKQRGMRLKGMARRIGASLR